MGSPCHLSTLNIIQWFSSLAFSGSVLAIGSDLFQTLVFYDLKTRVIIAKHQFPCP